MATNSNPTDDQLNRKCAERLGWTLRNYNEDEREACCEADYADAANNDGWHWDGDPSDREAWAVDFLHDPAANEMLLEAMPEPRLNTVRRFKVKHWVCVPLMANNYVYAGDRDRKRAIVLAFLAL